MIETSNQPGQKLSRSKKLLFTMIMLLLLLFLLEAGLRVYFAFRIGPSVLWYGGSLVKQEWADHRRQSLTQAGVDYLKYSPYQIRNDKNPDTGESFRVTINGRGLRGDDYPDEKAPGTLRVITLGASSTFGYYSPDEGTYPRRLEKILNDECDAVERFEVINFGIPHLLAEEILSLFVNEGLPLDPDIVTYYEGINDAGEVIIGRVKGDPTQAPTDAQPTGLLARLKRISILRESYRALRHQSVLTGLVDGMWSNRFQTIDKAHALQRLESGVNPYLATLDKLLAVTREHGVVFILANQQAKSESIEREKLKGLTYLEEAGILRERLDRKGRLGKLELSFLMHARLMAAFKTWAAENSVPFADVIEATDQDRDVLLSWVHLSQKGNALVARCLADVILEQTCH